MNKSVYKSKILTTLLILLSCLNLILAQPPNIVWQKSLGGSDRDITTSIQQTSDSGYIVSGTTRSNDGDVIGHNASDTTDDAWILKLDNIGNIQWQKPIGGTNIDFVNSIQQTTDHGYIFVGYSYSNDGDINGNHGFEDIWLVKLDSVGNILWQKMIGGSSYDKAFSVQQTNDGNYIIAGVTASTDGDATCGTGYYRFWVIKTDNNGIVLWQKCLGGSNYNGAYSIQQTTDGGYIAAGNTVSNDGDVIGNHGGFDYWVVKLDNTGNLQWQKCLGGTGTELVRKIVQTTDGGYIVVGNTASNDGDVTGNHGGTDYWVVKLNNAGNIQWQKTFGGSAGDEAYSVQQTNDGGYVVSGYTASTDGDVTGNLGGGGCWIVKLDNLGIIQWQKYLNSWGGGGYSIIQQSNGDYVVASGSSILGTDATGNHGDVDCWIVKLGNSEVGLSELKNNNSIEIYPNPAKEYITVELKNYKKVDGNKIYIVNSIGQIVLIAPLTNNSTKIDLCNIKCNGIYLVRLRDSVGNTLDIQKIIIQ